jgi:glyoxylase-like metal-dependent hydrolase (beta-lactamase superfamily II)
VFPPVQSFFDPATYSMCHVVHEADGGACAVVDPILDYDPASGRTSTKMIDRVCTFLHAHRLQLQWILETHAHADHFSGAKVLQREIGGRIAIGRGVCAVQEQFRGILGFEAAFAADGSQFDRLLDEGDELPIGDLRARVMHLPGHTQACVAYKVGDAVFIGDTIFPPDVGSARCDFPGGDAASLYRSIRRVLALPGETRLYLCHDYPPAGREVRFFTTVEEQRAQNIHFRDSVTQDEFVAMRLRRDASLPPPNLMLPALQVNLRGGELPAPEENGIRYLKIPLDAI